MEKTEMARETAESFLSLTEFLLDIDCLDELTRKASKINIFDVLKISRTEIRHSNMLDWLLDPNENHGFGDAVIRRFIQFAAPQNEEFMIQKKDVCDFKVYREWHHTDLLAVSNREKIVLCLENKIDSGEHHDQLNRYRHEVETAFPDFTKLFIFLTPDGIKASSLGWRSMSYKDVQSVIKQELEKAELTPDATLLLCNYLDIIEYIIGERKEDQLARICEEIYEKHQKALELIFKYRPDNARILAGNLRALEKEETAESKIEYALGKTCEEVYAKHRAGLDLLLKYRPDKAQKLSKIFCSWAEKKTAERAITFVPEKSGTTMTRFKTLKMSNLFRETEENFRETGSQNYYFYEIRNINGCAFRMQFAVSSKSIPKDIQKLCDRISLILRNKLPEEDWEWRTFFSTGRIEINEDFSKETIYKQLDNALEKMLIQEQNLIEKLKETDPA